MYGALSAYLNDLTVCECCKDAYREELGVTAARPTPAPGRHPGATAERRRTMAIEVDLSVMYAHNQDKYRGEKEGYFPCANCYRPVKTGPGTRWVHCAGGGMTTYITDDEYERGEVPLSDMGCWPLGPDCYRRLRRTHGPELDKYISVE